jgi:hypothetical protein
MVSSCALRTNRTSGAEHTARFVGGSERFGLPGGRNSRAAPTRVPRIAPVGVVSDELFLVETGFGFGRQRFLAMVGGCVRRMLVGRASSWALLARKLRSGEQIRGGSDLWGPQCH